MGTINTGDTIYATAIIKGRTSANLRLCGLHSMSEVINAIKSEVGSAAGLVTITLRNMTQGWHSSKALYLTPACKTSAGIQLSLF